MSNLYPYSAHLCLHIDTKARQIVGAGIYSAPPSGLTVRRGYVYAELTSVRDSSFDLARRRLIAIIRESRTYDWVRVWLQL